MSTGSATITKKRTKVPEREPRTVTIAKKGIKTSKDFANFMSCLMPDLVEGKVTPNVGNASCNAGGKLLKVIEMEYKYGTPTSGRERQAKTLKLAVETDEL